MSSPNAAPHKRAAKRARPLKVAPASAGAGIKRNASADAFELAAEVERGLTKGDTAVLTPEAVQALMAAACKVYSVQVEAGRQYLPLKAQSVAPTEVMVTASGLLRSVNLAVFELGMWQSWTGR